MFVCVQEGSGKISLRMLQSYASKHGGETLTLDDLKGETCCKKSGLSYLDVHACVAAAAICSSLQKQHPMPDGRHMLPHLPILSHGHPANHSPLQKKAC
jgi:hypothetical protein